jgi:hypothetical protein
MIAAMAQTDYKFTTIDTRPDTVDALIVGGHAGFAMSALLTQASREHLAPSRQNTETSKRR